MILLLIFAFFAGVVTVLSPCIFPILPIILSSSVGGRTGYGRPVGVVAGFVASFTFFTLFLSSIVRWSGVPADSLRVFAMVVIGGFGVSLLIPQVQKGLEWLFARLVNALPSTNTHPGFISGALLGLSLGLLWTPCVGPILAAVISLALVGTISLDAVFITLAYALGTAGPMLAIMVGGQNALQRVPWLSRHTGDIQKAFGVVMVVTAIGLAYNVDRSFQTWFLNTFPQYGTGLTKFEEFAPVQRQLDQLRDASDAESEPGESGSSLFSRPNAARRAPEIIVGGEWLNSAPLTVESLRGKVVLIDFWTYSCINCQRTLPYLRSWWEKYQDDGLVIVGVHSPEFEFEKNIRNVEKAVTDFDLKYPIMQDNNFATWRAYDNHYWPAKYLIDAQGNIRYMHFGEGKYDETERMIQDLLIEAGRDMASEPIDNPAYQIYSRTGETYLGYSRVASLRSPEQIIPDTLGHYSLPQRLAPNSFAVAGDWLFTPEYAQPEPGGQLRLNFESKEVFVVMRTADGTPARVTVRLDGATQFMGEDVMEGQVTVDSDRLYKLILLPEPGRHTLELEFPESEVQLFAFTFG